MCFLWFHKWSAWAMTSWGGAFYDRPWLVFSRRYSETTYRRTCQRCGADQERHERHTLPIGGDGND